MTASQARIIDPILTGLVLGYKNAAYVGEALFPRVSVGQRAGKIVQFNKEDWRLPNSRRAPGTKVGTVDVNYGNNQYALEDHNLDGKVPIELMQEANAVPHINLQKRAINKVQRQLSTRLEFDQAALARTAGNYGAQIITYNGASSWKNAAATPINDVLNARNVVQASIGVFPNTLVLSNDAYVALQEHQTLIDRLKYTSADSVTVELIARLMQVEKVVVAAALYTDDSGVSQKIWGQDAILAYVAQGAEDNEEPSYGFTYTLNGYPNAEESWYDRDVKSWRCPYNDCRAPQLTGIAGGYLLQNAGQ